VWLTAKTRLRARLTRLDITARTLFTPDVSKENNFTLPIYYYLPIFDSAIFWENRK
jgi:hypothetical protein